MSSIALSATPAFAQSSQGALHISNGRADFTDISAHRRHHAKPRYKKARHAKAGQAGVRDAKGRSVKRHTAKPRHVSRNVANHDAYAPIPDQHSVISSYRYGAAEPHRTSASRTLTPSDRPAPRRRIAAGYDAHASIPDRHSIVTNYQYGAVQPYQTSAYYAVTAPSRPEPRRRTAVRQPTRHEDRDYYTGWGASSVVAEARRYIGTNPTKYSRLWCAHFMNMVLERTGHRGTGSGFAKSFASYGTRVSGPQVGAIAVMSRGRNGGHVGVVSGIDASGNPIIISGNHNKRVAEAVYPRGRIYAYVMP